MTALILDDGLSFAIENNEKRARLIVYKDGVENVCRKETLKNLVRFMLSDEKRLFEGRLQLVKDAAGIGIEVKGQVAGTIKAEEFLNYLETLEKEKQTEQMEQIYEVSKTS